MLVIVGEGADSRLTGLAVGDLILILSTSSMMCCWWSCCCWWIISRWRGFSSGCCSLSGGGTTGNIGIGCGDGGACGVNLAVGITRGGGPAALRLSGGEFIGDLISV